MRSFRIGSVFGIPLKLDLTFLLVLPLFAYIIASQVGATVDLLNTAWGASLPVGPLEEGALPWLLGITSALGLFAGVVLHELGHSLVAMRYGFPIKSITLWLLGGMAQLSEMPEDWKQELAIAIAGPIVSVGVGLAAFAGFLLTPTGFPAARFVLGYLALVNVALAVFNLLPAFPMDGGRVLRALLARKRPYARATQLAAEVGKGFAILMGLFGLFGGGGIFLIALAFFIYIAASGEAQQTTLKAAFEGVTVGDVMTPGEDVDTVGRDLSVADLIDRMFRERHTGYPVIENGSLVGMVTLEDARGVEEVERDAYRVEDVMTDDLHTIGADEDAMAAMNRMNEHRIGRLVVTDETGSLVGLLSRSDLMTALNIIRQSGSNTSLRRTEPSSESPTPEFQR